MGEEAKGRSHPIEGLMITAMDSIQGMVDVNTIIGEPIETSVGSVIIPISKVTFGFAAGGSEFKGETIDEYNKKDKDEQIQYRLPFGGGAGAGVSINPVAFLVVQSNVVKLLPVDHSNTLDKILDYVPDLIEKANCMMNKCIQNKKDLGDKIINNMKKKCENINVEKKQSKEDKNDDTKSEVIKEVVETEVEVATEQE